ncbi:hypothetical protein MBLNU457_6351t1 [Dothideomycetes sp. NU457]
MRQLLSCLTAIFCTHQDLSIVRETKPEILDWLSVVFPSVSKSKFSVKSAILALTHLLLKGALSTQDLTSYLSTTSLRERNTTDDLSAAKSAIEDLLQWVDHDELASSIAPLIAYLANPTDQGSKAKESSRQLIWAEPVLSHIKAHPSSIENYRHYLLPALFSESFVDYLAFVNLLGFRHALNPNISITASQTSSDPINSEFYEETLYSALLVGNNLSWIILDDAISGCKIDEDTSPLHLPTKLLARLLYRQSRAIRIAALNLLLTSPTTTKPLTKGTFAALKQALPALHSDTDANFRSELFGITQRLIDRLRAVTAVLSRTKVQDTTLSTHIDYLKWYRSFLRMELRPCASYQRHISALKCLELVQKSGIDRTVSQAYWSKSAIGHAVWPTEILVVTADTRDILLDLLLDPFDDVRATAASILRLSGSAIQKSSDTEDDHNSLIPVLDAAEELSERSGRADQADGAAHLYAILFDQARADTANSRPWFCSRYGIVDHLLTQVEDILSLLETDSAKAVTNHPLHGVLSSVRYILDRPDLYNLIEKAENVPSWQPIFKRLHNGMERAWKDVHHILCNDAPEGFMPEDLEDDEATLTTKDVLSYSWRALKETGLLIRALVTKCPVSTETSSLMTPSELRSLGDLCFVQLVELRHRGAFSTVAQTFVACCVRCASTDGLQNAVQEWYNRALSIVCSTETINTRRSAGLPSLIVGVLSADASGTLFDQAIQDLTQQSRKPLDEEGGQSESLTQVHALNCLKDVFKSSRLGEKSEAYISPTLELAAECLSSPAWGIRNSGLMLFRALLDRLLGTNDSYINDEVPPTSQVSLSKVPNLMDIVLRLLSDSTAHQGPESAVAEGVFPALQILQRAPSSLDRLREVQDAVFHLMSSPHWHVRDKAARTYTMLSPSDELLITFTELLETPLSSQNTLHGALLCAKYVLRRLTSNGESSSAIQEALERSKHRLYEENTCPFTRSAYVEIVTIVRGTPNSGFNASGELHDLLSRDGVSWPAEALLRQSLAQNLICQARLDEKAVQALLALATRDADAFIEAVAGVVKKVQHDETSSHLDASALASLACLTLTDSKQTDSLWASKTRDAAQALLLSVINSPDFSDQNLAQISNLDLVQTGQSPLSQDTAMILSGTLLAKADLSNEKSQKSFSVFVNTLQNAVKDDKPFDTRMAAAQAVHRFVESQRTNLTVDQSDGMVEVLLIVYDLTNDDDDDVRDLAAHTTSLLLDTGSRQKTDMVSLVAGSRIAASLAYRHKTSIHLARGSAHRLLADTSLTLNLLSESQGQDSALFAEEKQNLFIDPAREAKTWSVVLSSLSATAFDDATIRELSDLTTAGLDALISRTRQNHDGPLGWTRKPDIFVLGLRIIYASEVVIHVARETKRALVPASAIRGKLVTLLGLGKETRVNMLWLGEIEKVINKSLDTGFTKLSGVLRHVEIGAMEK